MDLPPTPQKTYTNKPQISYGLDINEKSSLLSPPLFVALFCLRLGFAKMLGRFCLVVALLSMSEAGRDRPKKTEVEYKGCYMMPLTQAEKVLLFAIGEGEEMSPKSCWEGCNSLGYAFVTIQRSNCACTQHHPPSSRSRPQLCTAKCESWQAGDTTHCGGTLTFDLFRIVGADVLPLTAAPTFTPPTYAPPTYTPRTATPTRVPVPTLEIEEIELKGCFADTHLRVLPASQGKMYPHLCLETCFQAQYRYAGIYNNRECGCGNDPDVDRHGLPESPCSACKDDPELICGGTWDVSVYDLRPSRPTPSRPDRWHPVAADVPYAVHEGCIVEGQMLTEEQNGRAPEFHFFGWIGDEHEVKSDEMCFAVCYQHGFGEAALNMHDQCYCGQKLHDEPIRSTCASVCDVFQASGLCWKAFDIISLTTEVVTMTDTTDVSEPIHILSTEAPEEDELSPLVAILLVICTLVLMGTAAYLGKSCRGWGQLDDSETELELPAGVCFVGEDGGVVAGMNVETQDGGIETQSSSEVGERSGAIPEIEINLDSNEFPSQEEESPSAVQAGCSTPLSWNADAVVPSDNEQHHEERYSDAGTAESRES